MVHPWRGGPWSALCISCALQETCYNESVKVRRAKQDELNEIFMMGYDAWGASLPIEIYLDSCAASYKYKQGEFYVLLDDEGRLLSSCVVYPLSVFGGVVGERSVGFGSLATAEPQRHKGYATFFLTLLMRLLESEGVDAFFIFSDIPPKIYEQLGFVAAPERFRSAKEGSMPMLRFSGGRKVSPEHWQECVMPKYF